MSRIAQLTPDELATVTKDFGRRWTSLRRLPDAVAQLCELGVISFDAPGFQFDAARYFALLKQSRS